MRIDAHAQRAVGGRRPRVEPLAERAVRGHARAVPVGDRVLLQARHLEALAHGTRASATAAPSSSAIVVNSGLVGRDRRRADLVAVGARAPPLGVLTTMSTSPRLMSSTIVVLVAVVLRRRELAARRSARDAVAAQHLGGALGRDDVVAELLQAEHGQDDRRACRGRRPRRRPCPTSGMPPYAATWLFANARREVAVDAHDLARRAHLGAEHRVDDDALARCGSA